MSSFQRLSSDDFRSFFSAKQAAAILFDTEWDISGRAAIRFRMQEAQASLAETVNFGEVDCDLSPDLATDVRVPNAPSVAYYLDGKLIAALTGAGQNVLERLRRILRGEQIGYDDGTEGLNPTT